MDYTQFLNSVAEAAIITMLVAALKPFVEALPFGRPSASTHDATLRLVSILLNVGLVLAVAAAQGQLTNSNALAYGLVGLAQAAGAHVFYNTVHKSSGGSGGDTLASTFSVQPDAPGDTPGVVTAAQVAAATFTAQDAPPDVPLVPVTTQAGN